MKKLKSILQYNLLYIFLLIIVIILTVLRINFDNNDSYYNEQINSVKGYVLDYKIDVDKITVIIKAKEKLLVNYYTKNKVDFSYGDYVLVKGKFIKPKNNTNSNLFNYKKYLLSQKINYTITADNIKKIDENKNILYTLKRKILKQIEKSKKSFNYIKTFIFADKNYINDNVIDAYRTLGISHLFAVSGMHVSLVSLLLLKILKKYKEVYKYSIISAFLIFYLFLTNYTISMFRACFQFILFFINRFLKLEIKNSNIVILLFSIFLLYNPYYIYNSAFLFSFSISFSLIYFSNVLKDSNFISSLIKVTILSFIISLPITINNFNQINFFSIIYNIIFVPFVCYILFPLNMITFIFPYLDNINYIIINIFENICLILSNINVLKFNVSNIPVIFSVIYYLLVIIYLNKKNIKYIYMIIFLLLIFIVYKEIVIFPKIIILDVGQGDSSLIRIFNKNILIDTGGIVKYNSIESNYSISDNTLIPFFYSEGVKKIDYLILSHGDYDHMGEAINLVNNFKVENVIFNNDNYNELEKGLIEVLGNKNIKYYKGLKELNIGNNKLYFLNTKEYGNENDNSNVLYFKLNDYQFLFMGDAGTNREKDILEKYNLTDIDFIKIGHHGSNTSSSKEFIDNIKPKNCLISVGAKNRYGHPKEKVLDILNDYCDIYRTDLNGSIEIKIDNNGYKIKTYSPYERRSL